MSVITSRETSAKLCTVAGQNILKTSLLFIEIAMLLEVLIEDLALGAVKLIKLPSEKRSLVSLKPDL